jgi:hypothetical protein
VQAVPHNDQAVEGADIPLQCYKSSWRGLATLATGRRLPAIAGRWPISTQSRCTVAARVPIRGLWNSPELLESRRVKPIR